MREKFSLVLVGAASVALLVACGGGGGSEGNTSGVGTVGGGGSTAPASGSGALSSEVDGVPLVGQFLATCLDTGVAILETFVAAAPVSTSNLPLVGNVLVFGDPDLIAVIGGLAPSGLLGTLSPIDIDQALSQIPLTGLSSSLPVMGLAPVTCSDVPALISELPDPTDAIGLVPIFDASGNPIGVVLATAGAITGGSLPAIDAVPSADEGLLAPLVSTVTSLLSILGL